MAYKKHSVSVIIPVHNEELSIGRVVADLKTLSCLTTKQPLVDEIIVCDNASTDRSAEEALAAGATVVSETTLGYGVACLKAMSELSRNKILAPDLVVFVDGDYSVKSSELPLLLDIWGKSVNDLGPFRAMKYTSLMQLDMQDQRFGWTVEMQVKAIQAKMAYCELPVTTLRRIGKSKISGTVKGTIGAAIGIFGKIFTLYMAEEAFLGSLNKARLSLNKEAK